VTSNASKTTDWAQRLKCRTELQTLCKEGRYGSSKAVAQNNNRPSARCTAQGPTNALPSIFLHFPLTSSVELQFRFFATADLTLARTAQNEGTIDSRWRELHTSRRAIYESEIGTASVITNENWNATEIFAFDRKISWCTLDSVPNCLSGDVRTL